MSLWKEYTNAVDRVAAGEGIEDFRQLLGEHAVSLLALARDYGSPSRQLALISDQERLTDVHQAWADRVTRRHDPHEWKRVARSSIRAPAHCATQLIGAYASGSATSAAHHSKNLHSAAELAAEFHCSIDPDARACQNGDLRHMWRRYAEMIGVALAMQLKYGASHEMYYQACAAAIKTARTLGSTMDTLRMPV
jgi:hypothetical protein